MKRRTVVSAPIKQAKKLPKELYKSLTLDRGQELTEHQRFSLSTNVAAYFCDPRVRGRAILMKIPTDYFGSITQRE